MAGDELPPLLTFDEAQRLGEELHDHWQKQADPAPPPLARDDFAWADMVQFVLRRASGIVREREEREGL